jgi:signal transduction histidine kinase/CheY-like chemotaxis protein
MIKSLKSQVLFVLITLVSILIVQVMLSRSSQSTLIINQQTISHAYHKVGLVHQLERDIIDLQRNLLIYKETASESSISRFYELMEKVEKRLTFFERDTAQYNTIEIDTKQLSRMRTHLEDYKNNFSDVIDGRTQRKKIYNDKILSSYQKLNILIDHDKELSALNNATKIRYRLALSEKLVNRYLVSPDYDYISQFNQQFAEIKKLIPAEPALNPEAISLLKALKTQFFRLTQITRGYVFLVNVVMAGSANEFLYLTKKLRETVQSAQTELSHHSRVISQDTEAKNDFVAIISILIALFMALLLTFRIIRPIRDITDVFSRLAKGEPVDAIPGIERHDEIGNLAKAADVFHAKNKQTTQLLKDTQEANIQKEALNNALAKEKTKAEQAAESKSMFLANMSHEIRTPMNGIIGLIDLTRKTELTDDQAHFLKKAAYSGQIMMNVINDILDFSKIEAGKMDIESIEFYTNDIIDNVISAIETTLEDKTINFRVFCSPNLPKKLIGDPLRISQILLNLCSNAVKFTENGLVQIILEYRQGKESYLDIKVKDSGIGMSSSQIKHVFDSFTQADGTTSRKYGGTGLGLTIVKQLAVMMGGSISADSEQGKGSCFTVDIKVREPDLSATTAIAHKQEQVIFYLRDENDPLLSTAHFRALNITARYITWKTLTQTLEQHKAPATLLIDITSKNNLANNIAQLRSPTGEDLDVAFITNNYPFDLADAIKEHSNAAILAHPFSPNQLDDFLVKLLSIEQQKAEIDTNIEATKTALTGHILLVEDNMVNQLVAGHMLDHVGVSHDIAENGLIAVEKVLSDEHYDLILMDVQMPIMDGYEATRKIRKAGFSELIICGLSANAMKKDIELAAQAGMSDYLTKPLELESLDTVLRKYLTTRD